MTSDKEGFLNIQKHLLQEKFDYIKIKNVSSKKELKESEEISHKPKIL